MPPERTHACARPAPRRAALLVCTPLPQEPPPDGEGLRGDKEVPAGVQRERDGAVEAWPRWQAAVHEIQRAAETSVGVADFEAAVLVAAQRVAAAAEDDGDAGALAGVD